MKTIYLFGILMWFLILILAIINGILREKFYKSQQLSSIILSLAILLATYIFLKAARFAEEPKTYLLLGLMWMIMTVAFEFLFFHYVTGHSWQELIANYDILHGNLWSLVVVTTGVSPWLMSRFI